MIFVISILKFVISGRLNVKFVYIYNIYLKICIKYKDDFLLVDNPFKSYNCSSKSFSNDQTNKKVFIRNLKMKQTVKQTSQTKNAQHEHYLSFSQSTSAKLNCKTKL